MDKTKLRKKRKRQAEKRREREAEAKDLAERLGTMFREKGYNPKRINQKAVMREYNNIQRQSVATAIVYTTICTLYCMRKMYGYGKLRLFRLATEITVRVNNVATTERSIYHMIDDLGYDAQLDTRSYWKDVEYSDKLSPERKAELECIAMNIPHLMAIQMYAVHMALGFKKRRMNRLCEMVVESLRYVLAHDKIDSYIDSLKSCGFYTDLKGKFGAHGIKEEIYTKFRQRINWSGGDLLNAKQRRI